MFPMIYNRRNLDIGTILKGEYLHLQTVMKKSLLWRAQLLHIEKNPSLIDILVSTRLPTNPVTL